MSDLGLGPPKPALPMFYSSPEEAAAVYGSAPTPVPAQSPAPAPPAAPQLPMFYSSPEEATAVYGSAPTVPVPVQQPSLAETMAPQAAPVVPGPPPERSGFFTGIGAGGQEALRLGTQTLLQGRPFEVDPNAPPETGDEGWWYRFGKGVGYSSPTLAAGLGGGALGFGLGSLGGPAAPVSAPVASLIGAGLGIGGMSLAQDLAPTYAQQIQAGKTHDEAVDYAWKHGITTGVVSGTTAWIPGPFKSALGHILYQTFFAQPVSGAAVRTGVPLVMGEPLPSTGEYIEGYGQDVMAGAGFAGAHAVGRRAVQAVRPAPPAPPPTARSEADIAARQAFTPGDAPASTERIETPAPAPSTIFPQPRPGEVTRTEIAPEQYPPTVVTPAVSVGEPYAQTFVEPAPASAPRAVDTAAPLTELSGRVPVQAGTQGPAPLPTETTAGSRLVVPTAEPLPVEPAVVPTSPRPPVIGEPVDRPGATTGRPGEPAPVGEAGAARVEPGPYEVQGRPGVGPDTGERPPDIIAGARPGEQPAPLTAVPAGEARPEVGAEPAVHETLTAAGEQAAPVTHPYATVEIRANRAGGFDVETPLEGIQHVETMEQAERLRDRYTRLVGEQVARYEQETGRNYADDWHNNAVDAAAAQRARAEAPGTEPALTRTPEEVQARRKEIHAELGALQRQESSLRGQFTKSANAGIPNPPYLVRRRDALLEQRRALQAEERTLTGAETSLGERAPVGYGPPEAETGTAPVARLTTEPDDVVPGQHVAKNEAGEVVGKGVTPEEATADAQRRGGEVYPAEPAPAAVTEEAAARAAYTTAQEALTKAQSVERQRRLTPQERRELRQLEAERDRARAEWDRITQERAAEAPTGLEDQAAVPGTREDDLGTTGPRETPTEPLPALAAPTQLEQLTAERDRLAAKSRTIDETRQLRQLNRQIEDLQPRPGKDTQLGKLLDTRDALEAKSRTLDETLKLRRVNKQIETLRRAEERRGGRKLPYSGQPPEAGRPKDFLDYKFNDGTSVFRSVLREAGYDPDVATNRPVQWQNRVLTKHMKDTFGFTDVEVAGYRPGADATPVQHVLARDAMLDTFRGAKDGMATMGLPYESLSLDGKLKLIIEPAGPHNKYYGAYVPAAGELRVIAGANSLGHEWTHAWDHELTQWATGNSAQQTRLFSQYTRDGNLDPTNDVHAAFAKVLNTMFYDDGALALHRINLETAAQKTDRAGAPTKAALEAQRQLDLLEKGASQQRIGPSEFRLRSRAVDPTKPYWVSPWEMLARAHEAYIAWKMTLEGKDPRGFVMPDEAYIKETDRQLSLAYPKAEDRMRIFAAFDELHVAMLKEQVLSGGKPPGKWADYGVSDPHYQDKTAPGFGQTMVGRAFNAEAAKYSNLSRSIANVALRDKTRPTRPGDLTWWDGLKDGFKAITYSTHGIMETLIARAPKAAQEHLTDLLDRLATAPGEGRFTRENFEEAIRNRTRGWMSQYANILKNNGLDPEHMPAAEDAALRHLMVTGETTYEGKTIAPHIVKTAGDLRFLMDKMWRASYNAGLDVGYSSRYFPRLYDMAKFFSDETGFRTAATKLYRFMYDKELGAPGSDPQSVLEKWTTLSKVERAQADPALETQMGELNSNLRRQREIEANPNPTPAETAALNQLKLDATQLAKAIHDPLGDHVASIAADHWHARMAKGNHADFDTIGPSGKYLNARTLPPEADVIMKDFLRTDTRDAIPNYIHAVARKVSYAERFGAKGEYLDQAFEKLRNVPGVNHADMQKFRSLIDNITGRANDKSALYNDAQSLHNVLHAIGSIALMPRAMWSALAEPMNAALATGSARVGLKTFVNQVGFLWDRASALERTEFANFLNVTQSSMMDSILLSRMSADYSDSPRLNRLMTMYYKVTGLTQLTNSQRIGAAAANNWFLAKLSRDYLDTGTSTRRENARDNAERWFSELGLNPNNHEAFAKWMTDLEGNLPSIERLQTDDMASAYGLAIRRLTDRVIQDPYKVDRAALASFPLLGLAFQMMSFNYQFQRNVLNPLWSGIEHSYGRAKMRAEDKGAGSVAATGQGILAAGGATAHAAAMAGTVIGAGLMTTALRQLIFAPDQWKQHEADGDLEDYLLNLTFQRSGLNGTLDPIVQLFSNLRYNADVTSLIGGATPHWIGRNAQDIIQPFVTTNDSPNSNTRIFNATRGAYNLFGVPLMSTGLTMAGNIGGPISKVIAGGLLQYGTSPGAAADVTEAIVGSPKGAKREKETADGLPKLPELPGLPELPELPKPGEEDVAGGGGSLIPWGLVDDFIVPAWRYGGPVVTGLPRTIKGAAAAAGAAYGASRYLEATEPFRGQPAPEPKTARQ